MSSPTFQRTLSWGLLAVLFLSSVVTTTVTVDAAWYSSEEVFEEDHEEHDYYHHPAEILDSSNIGLEREHIQQHMDVPVDTSKMTEKELLFHYFKMHDTDKNNMLDGCELMKSVLHSHKENNSKHEKDIGIFSDKDLAALIDPVLKNDDRNGDGMIDYFEFSMFQSKTGTKSKAKVRHKRKKHVLNKLKEKLL